jgi:L-amino acid N-acyltransferase YncA
VRLLIIPMPPALWPSVRKIYAEGIATGNATFETEIPDWEKWDATHRRDCRLVAAEPTEDEAEFRLTGKITVLGWAALSPVSARDVYRGVAEVSVYVAAAARGRNIGKALLESLIQESESVGIWTLQAAIFPENVPSFALHRSCGFREVGIRRRLGMLGGVWRDVLLLERRSAKVGI